jgi:DNA-damage-inducible protein D
MDMESEDKMAVFQGKGIRRTFADGRWFFSVIDVVGVLTDSVNPRDYWYRLKDREAEASEIELSTFCRQLKLIAEDGKLRETDCADTEALFRIIQSVPSKKAEPFKRWLAKVGFERVEEIHDPQLAMKRMKAIYRAKGYSDDWVEKRARGIAVREELTDERRRRGIGQDMEFSILTAEISNATFGMTPGEYKRFKGLKSQELRDHMNDLELIFTMLGEAATTEIARNKDARGFPENTDAARKGGGIAGGARRNLEKESGRAVSTPENYVEINEMDARKRMKGDSQPALPAIPDAKGRPAEKGKGSGKKLPDAEEE